MPDTEALQLRGLTKIYPGGVQALHGVDLRVQAGAFYALLGPNGAGKSTTISIVASLLNKTAGLAQVYGFDLDTQLAQAKRCIGLVPQEFNFNSWEKVRDILIYQAGYYGIRRREALPRSEYLLRELDLWEKRSVPSRTLSGGMKRRLMIARALMHQPRLLILDEPTAGVDIEIRRHMWGFLRELNAAGTTIILTTHYLEEAEALCRDVAIIDAGRIIEQGKVAELLSRAQVETFVLDTQASEQTLGTLSTDAGPVAARWSAAHQLEVVLPRGTQLHPLLAQLDAQGIAVTGMRNKSNRLEELFLRLVTQDPTA